MGLLAAGRNRRAAAALWLFNLPLAALLVLLAVPRYWPAVMGQDLAVDPLVFEKIVLVAGGLAAVGMLGWLVQALEGARLVQVETGTPRGRRGDLYGLALLGAVAALFALAEPAPVARYLGREARTLQEQGLRLIPLVMVRTATVLDPGRTDYTVTTLEILDAMGRPRPAAEIRNRLEDDLASYLEMVRREEDRHRDLRRRAEIEAASRASFPMGWFAPDPFPMSQKDPEDESSGSR
jgi:hypothetical protein